MCSSVIASADEVKAKPSIKFATAIIPPYQVYDDNHELSGYAIPVIHCISNKLNIDADIQVYPWARAQRLVEIGEKDAFFVASQNTERDAYALKSLPLFSGKRSWYFRSGQTLDINSNDFRESGIVGTVFGTNMHTKLNREFKNVVTKTSEPELIELLNLGRIDGLLLTELMFQYGLSSLDIPEERFEKLPAGNRPLGVYFSREFINDNPAFLERFNSHIDACIYR